MDDSLLQSYILKRKIDRPGFSMLKEEQVLELMNITRNGKPTLAAVMNFCVYPQGFFPQLAITAVVVPGTEMGVVGNNNQRFLDNKRIEGTIKTMLEEAVSFSARNMKVQTIIDSVTGMRNDRTEYPIKAIREAVLNALIHRDYSPMTEGTPIQIIFFSDRLKIHSPGNLYGRMTIEELGFARPDLRNPALAVMAENLVEAENRYSGIPTIRLEMKNYNLPEPVFENRRNEFVVTLYNNFKQNNTSIELNESDLIAFCKIPRSRKEISDYLGLKTSSYAMERFINPLVDKGILEMTIPDKPKSTYQKFVVKKKTNV